MIADPLWSCVMLLCGPLWVLCGPLRSFAVFSHTLPVFPTVETRVYSCTEYRRKQRRVFLAVAAKRLEVSG